MTIKLHYSPASPFVRKVWLAIEELGLQDRVERVAMNPMKRDDMARSPNPLRKVPCLITEDGGALYDSPVIVEYLDATLGGNRLIPASGPARWTVLRRQALADGMVDATVLAMIEGMRKPERQSAGWIAHNMGAVERGLDALEAEADALGKDANAGTLAIAVALELLPIHLPGLDWRKDHTKLAAWFDAFATRPSMTATNLVSPREVP
jgi:glutathione S-transferase